MSTSRPAPSRHILNGDIREGRRSPAETTAADLARQAADRAVVSRYLALVAMANTNPTDRRFTTDTSLPPFDTDQAAVLAALHQRVAMHNNGPQHLPNHLAAVAQEARNHLDAIVSGEVRAWEQLPKLPNSGDDKHVMGIPHGTDQGFFRSPPLAFDPLATEPRAEGRIDVIKLDPDQVDTLLGEMAVDARVAERRISPEALGAQPLHSPYRPLPQQTLPHQPHAAA